MSCEKGGDACPGVSSRKLPSGKLERDCGSGGGCVEFGMVVSCGPTGPDDSRAHAASVLFTGLL